MKLRKWCAVLTVGLVTACGGGDPIVGDWVEGGLTMSVFDSYQGTLMFDRELTFVSVDPVIAEHSYTIYIDGGSGMFCDYFEYSDSLSCSVRTRRGVEHIHFDRRPF